MADIKQTQIATPPGLLISPMVNVSVNVAPVSPSQSAQHNVVTLANNIHHHHHMSGKVGGAETEQQGFVETRTRGKMYEQGIKLPKNLMKVCF